MSEVENRRDAEAQSGAKGHTLAWKIQLTWFVLFSVNALCSSIMAALAGKYWSTIDVQDKFIAVVSIVANWSSVIMAFLYQAAQKANRGEPILNGGGGEQKETKETKIL